MKSKKTPKKLTKNLDLYHKFMSLKQYKKAFEQAIKAHKQNTASTLYLDYAMRAAFQLYDWNNVILYAKKILHREPNHLNALDALAHGFGGLHQFDKAKLYGLKALQLRDQEVLHKIKSLPPLPTNIKKSGKNIISFSLYGALPEYIEPAVLNSELAKDIYPNWTCRFYVDNSVPKEAIKRLSDNGAEIIKITKEQQNMPKTMWRFLAINDPNAFYVIFRDADSVISYREASAVKSWIQSGKRFHTIRDAASHTELMLAGLWGGIAGSIPNFTSMLKSYLTSENLNSRFADQYFLRYYIWQYARQDLYGTDDLFNFLNAEPFPTMNVDKKLFHVGVRESRTQFTGDFDKPDGTLIEWSLFSKINPLINDDLSYTLLPKERLICHYQAIVINKKFHAYIPKRYSLGISKQETKVTVKIIEDKDIK